VLDRHAAREPFISPYLLIIRTKGFNPHFSQGIYYGGGEAHDYGVALEKSAQRSYCCASQAFSFALLVFTGFLSRLTTIPCEKCGLTEPVRSVSPELDVRHRPITLRIFFLRAICQTLLYNKNTL
jgi:hypothetical protein